MKTVKDEVATLKRKRRVTVELDHGEYLLAFKADSYYRLSGQLDDIVDGHYIIDSDCVRWDAITQQWIEQS